MIEGWFINYRLSEEPMPLLVYVTKTCAEDAREHGMSTDLEKFKDRVESTQSMSLFDPFPPPYSVKKKLGGRQGRLIAEQVRVGTHSAVVFHRVLIRGSRDYDDFVADPIGYGSQHFRNKIAIRDLEEYVQERTETAPPPIKPTPTEFEYRILYEAFTHHSGMDSEDLVFETRDWVDQISTDRVSKQLALLCKPCLDLISAEAGLQFMSVKEKPGWGVWALRKPGRLVLITVATDANGDASLTRAKDIAAQLENASDEAILKECRRAYPALILADDELWIDLEREPVANMALSPEETRVLQSARSGEHSFPLFINGRAGSGKSTILQYLFADLLYFYSQNSGTGDSAPPIYLTANGELLRVAKSFVARLLRSEAMFAKEGPSATDNRSLLDLAFQEFQPFLISLLPQQERSRFAGHARVDYPRFRHLWSERFSKEPRALREYGPDLSWHVLRTYIKGMSSETFLDEDDYGQLPSNQISVTKAAFERVYERVWLGWYKPHIQDQGLWDDQDLTRYVLDYDLVMPKYPAVFCDEAQDFTRLELQLLLRMNVFSQRSLQPNDISRVPFAFAGDPFQTLNPTGFRWDAIKASFVEKFVFELDPERRAGRVDLNYRELQFNYRSTQPIVRFANQVQALRAALFQLTDVRPQTPWTVERDSFPVVWFRANDGEFWSRFRENPGIVVIVPCGEGEEAEFVNNDPILREQIRFEDDVPVNVLSAMRAKGCEYPAVVVYGFGQDSEIDLMKALQSGNLLAGNPDHTLPIQYFVNRLYVAVSRPKNRLIVVDSEEGFAKLWKCTLDETLESLMLDRVKNGRRVWGALIEGMSIGKPGDLAKQSAGDPLENAKAFELEGKSRRDPFLLKQAAQGYRSAGEISKAKECRARALDVEGFWFEAGLAYLDAGFHDNAVRCLWNAGADGWNELARRSTAEQLSARLECSWATVIVDETALTESLKILNRFADALGDKSFCDRACTESVWGDAVRALLTTLTTAKAHPAEGDEQWISCAAILDRISNQGVQLPPEICGHIYLLAKRYPDAISLWDRANVKPSPYHRAKASVAPYPERIISLASLRLYQEIATAYDSNQEISLTDEQASAAADALRESGRLQDAFSIAARYRLPVSMLRLPKAALKAGLVPAATTALLSGVSLSTDRGDWNVILSIFRNASEFCPTAEWKDTQLQKLVGTASSEMRFVAIRAVARSTELAKAPDAQKEISSFLRKYLRVKDGDWRAHLLLAEAGAAIERGGRFTDAISFYEAVANDNSFSKAEHLLARERWLVSKQRQLTHERMHGAASKAQQIAHDLETQKQALRISSIDDELSEFPSLEPLVFMWPNESSTTRKVAGASSAQVTSSAVADEGPPNATSDGQPIDPVILTAGTLKFEYSRALRRCNIVDIHTMAQGYIKVAERHCGGEVEFSRSSDHNWFCSPWKLVVRFPEDASQAWSLELQDSGIQVRIRQ
jgi:tetratricopeptide (TPR) repeat protein